MTTERWRQAWDWAVAHESGMNVPTFEEAARLAAAALPYREAAASMMARLRRKWHPDDGTDFAGRLDLLIVPAALLSFAGEASEGCDMTARIVDPETGRARWLVAVGVPDVEAAKARVNAACEEAP